MYLSVQNVERIGIVAAILSSSMLLPQVFAIYTSRDANGLSMVTFVIAFFASCLWAVYHVGHKTYVGAISGSINACASLLIIIGILVFREAQ